MKLKFWNQSLIISENYFFTIQDIIIWRVKFSFDETRIKIEFRFVNNVYTTASVEMLKLVLSELRHVPFQLGYQMKRPNRPFDQRSLMRHSSCAYEVKLTVTGYARFLKGSPSFDSFRGGLFSSLIDASKLSKPLVFLAKRPLILLCTHSMSHG